jgi:CheY-like chemotaxis protein
VLVVEDDPKVRSLSIRRIESLGFTALAAVDARSALDVLETGCTVHVLFTDMIMPGGTTGLELARMVRTRWPEVKILFTSGYADPSIMLTGSHMADTDWLSKPYRTEELSKKLHGLLRG